MWALARRYEPDSAAAEDAVQEVFLDIWKFADRYDPHISPESTFVAMIARRRLIDRARQRNRKIPTVVIKEDDAPVGPPADDAVTRADEANAIRRRMEEISPEQRAVLELAIDRGLSQAEIAQQLRMPLGTVKALARRGLMRLRELVNATPCGGTAEGDYQ